MEIAIVNLDKKEIGLFLYKPGYTGMVQLLTRRLVSLCFAGEVFCPFIHGQNMLI